MPEAGLDLWSFGPRPLLTIVVAISVIESAFIYFTYFICFIYCIYVSANAVSPRVCGVWWGCACVQNARWSSAVPCGRVRGAGSACATARTDCPDGSDEWDCVRLHNATRLLQVRWVCAALHEAGRPMLSLLLMYCCFFLLPSLNLSPLFPPLSLLFPSHSLFPFSPSSLLSPSSLFFSSFLFPSLSPSLYPNHSPFVTLPSSLPLPLSLPFPLSPPLSPSLFSLVFSHSPSLCHSSIPLPISFFLLLTLFLNFYARDSCFFPLFPLRNTCPIPQFPLLSSYLYLIFPFYFLFPPPLPPFPFPPPSLLSFLPNKVTSILRLVFLFFSPKRKLRTFFFYFSMWRN